MTVWLVLDNLFCIKLCIVFVLLVEVVLILSYNIPPPPNNWGFTSLIFPSVFYIITLINNSIMIHLTNPNTFYVRRLLRVCKIIYFFLPSQLYFRTSINFCFAYCFINETNHFWAPKIKLRRSRNILWAPEIGLMQKKILDLQKLNCGGPAIIEDLLK